MTLLNNFIMLQILTMIISRALNAHVTSTLYIDGLYILEVN